MKNFANFLDSGSLPLLDGKLYIATIVFAPVMEMFVHYRIKHQLESVILKKSSPTPEILFCTSGPVGCIDWCDQSQKLYVAYDIEEGVQMAIQAYDIA